MIKLILRFDDINPGFSWRKFEVFENISKLHGLCYLVGVIPDNNDPTIVCESPLPNYWDRIRNWKKKGWIIAQHGYRHEYVTDDSGILNRWSRSEFSGLNYKDQKDKLELGKCILQSEDVWEPTFMAPSHSFDANTLKALNDLDFTHITDGDGFFPYFQSGLISVPQVYAPYRFIKLMPGIYTLCLHVNSMNEFDINKMVNFIVNYKNKIITKSEFYSVDKYSGSTLHNIYGNALVTAGTLIYNFLKK